MIPQRRKLRSLVLGVTEAEQRGVQAFSRLMLRLTGIVQPQTRLAGKGALGLHIIQVNAIPMGWSWRGA